MHTDLAFMLLILLVPIVPAFVLFKFLPNTADLSGPLKGLNVKISGAFAGYVVGVLLSWQITTSLLEPVWADNWTIHGHVLFDDAPSSHHSPSEVVVITRPPLADIDPNTGELEMTVPIARSHNGVVDVERVVFTFNGYEPITVPLDLDQKHLSTYGPNYQVTFDAKRHQIQIGKPIVLTKAAQ